MTKTDVVTFYKSVFKKEIEVPNLRNLKVYILIVFLNKNVIN